MKPLNDDAASRGRIMRLKRIFGMIYGAAAGIAFAAASWGWDGYLLSKAHAYFPWSMLMIGLTLCVLISGACGWLTASLNSSLLGILFWMLAAAGFAWLTVALPMQLNPAIVSKLDPQLGALLNYSADNGFAYRFGITLVWVIPFLLIVGVTQIPITEPAVFSTSIFGKIAPLIFCAVVITACAFFTDSLINAHFRDAIISLDATIQYVVDHRGDANPDPALSRQMHVRALWEVDAQVQESRRLFVGSFDESLGEFHVLVKFGSQWVNCIVLYNQPNTCQLVQ